MASFRPHTHNSLTVEQDGKFAKTGTCTICDKRMWIVGFEQWVNGIHLRNITQAEKATRKEDAQFKYHYVPIFNGEVK